MKFSKAVIGFSYWLEEKNGYKYAKELAYELLNDTRSVKKKFFDFFMIFLVLSTIGIFIYEIKHPVNEWFYRFEDFAITVFILEWLTRLWLTSSIHKEIIEYHEKRQNLALDFELGKVFQIVVLQKLKFIFSPMSIVDLLAILPYYRPLRILRFFLLFRMFKLLRYAQTINYLLAVFKEKKFELSVLAIISIMTVFMASTIMFIVEGLGDNPNLNTFFDAVYWSIVTMATLGYGDIVPTTPEGRVVAIILMGGGLIVVVLATSIVTSAFSERLVSLRENIAKYEARKLKNFVAILGYGRMGSVLASQLKEQRRDFIIVDNDDKKIANAKKMGYLAYKSDVGNSDIIDNLILDTKISTVAILTGDDATNLSVLLGIKAVDLNLRTIVRANEKSNIKKFEISKADFVVFPYKFVAYEAIEYITSPMTFDILDDIFLESQDVKMDEILIPLNSPWVDKDIEELSFDDFRISLVGVYSKGENELNFNPKEYKLKAEDRLMILGLKEQINLFTHKLGKA